MDIIRRATLVLLRFLKQLNLFNSYTTNERQVRREIVTTRIYLILLPIILTILVIYSAQKELYHTVQVRNPSLDTYQRLLDAYPDTLSCPCSKLSIPYSTFVNLTPYSHTVCSSDFVSDRWLQYLYYDDASSYLALDIRSVSYTQFQLLHTFCESSKQAIVNAFASTFASAALINSRGMLSKSELVRIQVEAFTDDFIANIGSEQRRRRALFATVFDQNLLMPGLQTSAISFIDSTLNLKVKPVEYYPFYDDTSLWYDPLCKCDTIPTCTVPLGICSNSLYESEYANRLDIYEKKESCPTIINGFRSGCLPLNALLKSTLECWYNQSCLNNIMNSLPTANTSFNVLQRSIFNRSTPTTFINTLIDNLMVEQWSTQINYSLYFAACHPSSCFYTYTERFSILYVVTTLVGLLGGLIKILHLLCPKLTNVFYQIQRYILVKNANNPSGSVRSSKRKRLYPLINISLKFNDIFSFRTTPNIETTDPSVVFVQQIAKDFTHFEPFCTSKQRSFGCSGTNPYYPILYWLFIRFHINPDVCDYTRATNDNDCCIDANYY